MKSAKSSMCNVEPANRLHFRKNEKLQGLGFVLFLLGVLFSSFLVLAQRRDSDAVKWLIENNIKARPDEIVIRARLFTIVVDKHRMVVKTGSPEETVVVGFEDNVRMTVSGREISAEELTRGDEVVIIYRRTGTVREIHKMN